MAASMPAVRSAMIRRTSSGAVGNSSGVLVGRQTAGRLRFAICGSRGLGQTFVARIGVRIRQLLDSLLAHRRFIAFERRHEEALLVAERVVKASAAKPRRLFQVLDRRPPIALAPE